MAVKVFAIANVDKNKLNVTTAAGASDATNGVRVTIDDTIAASKTDVLLSLEAIIQRIKEDTWVPA